MKTRRRSYTEPTPRSYLLRNRTSIVSVSSTKRERLHQSCECIERLWDKDIPTELLQEILSRLGLKANINASLVCRTWCEAAASVRKLLQPPRRPWLFYEVEYSLEKGSSYILVDPSRPKSHIHKLDFPDTKEYDYMFSCSKDGWLLMRKIDEDSSTIFFLNPFTKKRLYLPEGLECYDGHCLAFSAPPTSASCVVMECVHLSSYPLVISTWRPGETAWTTHEFHQDGKRRRKWGKCVFVNGMFYCLSTLGHLGVFDPTNVTWNILPVQPCRVFGFVTPPVLMTEHEGDIFVLHGYHMNKPFVYKLNLEYNVWEAKRDLGGLTVFASDHGSSFILAGLERNIVYLSDIEYPRHKRYYSLVGGKGLPLLSSAVAWVEPPSSQQQC